VIAIRWTAIAAGSAPSDSPKASNPQIIAVRAAKPFMSEMGPIALSTASAE
jgi:hypothetical protein